MPSFFNRLGPKLILTALAFLFLLGIATSFLVNQGFRLTQSDATRRNVEGLEAQGRESLRDLTEREIQISRSQFQEVEVAGQEAAKYMIATKRLGGIPGFSLSQLKRNDNGVLFDPNPARHSDVWGPSFLTTIDAETERGLRDSAVLDALVPTLLSEHPSCVAIFYIDHQGTLRYYPVVGLADVLTPDIRLNEQDAYLRTASAQNATRKPYWMPPYVDEAGNGLLVTANIPVYDDNEFRGVIGLDMSLTHLIERLNNIKPTKSGYAFLVDRDGHLVAAPPSAIKDIAGQNAIQSSLITATLGMDLTNTQNVSFKQIVDSMRTGKSGVGNIDLGNKPVVVSYAPLPNVGWSLAIVAPLDEVTAQSSTVAAAISAGTDDTVRSTLLAMGVFFLLALLGTALLSRRLTRPITALVAGTQAVAAGDLSISIPVTASDELGLLAQSFNQMTTELAAARQRLESWNQTLERTVEQRTAELAAATAEAQEARTAAEQANHLKSQFLANMSHELRTPLNSVINFTRILSSGMRGPVNEGQIDYLNRVRQSGQHLLGLINDILDLSKIESGRMDLFKESLQLADLVQSVMSTMVALTKDKPIVMLREIPPDLPVIEADHTRIRQVLLNLLSNATKFTESGAITVRVVQQDGELVVNVIDSGIGIAPEHLGAVFEEFRQIEGASNRRYEGTGLGLAICRRLVELHGGRIWAESTPNVGSIFSFSLPITERALELDSDVEVVLPLPTQNGAVILVIDDDPATLEIVASYLGRDNYAVHGIADSRRALDVARKLQPAAIILDVMMPYRDGWQVLADLKADPDLQSVPVVLYTIIEEQKLGFYLGASAYLTKPIDEEQLRATVTRLAPKGATILVIDDDPNAIEIVACELEQANGYTVVIANGGQAALDQVAVSRPDLIILDLMMPEVDGFAVLDQLDRSPLTESIPVIVLTAKDLTAQEHEYLNKRVHGLLSKDLTSPENLLSKVNSLLETVIGHSTMNE